MSPQTNESSDFVIHLASIERQWDAGRVHFNSDVRVYNVEGHWDFTEDERGNLWYSPRELHGQMHNMRNTVRHMRRRALRDPEDFGAEESDVCDRGLEHLRSVANMEQRTINRDCVFRSVSEEQALQRREGSIRDEERLRRASERGSEWSRNEARLLGHQDEREAKKIQSEDKKNIVNQYAALQPSVHISVDATKHSGQSGQSGRIIESKEMRLRQALELGVALSSCGVNGQATNANTALISHSRFVNWNRGKSCSSSSAHSTSSLRRALSLDAAGVMAMPPSKDSVPKATDTAAGNSRKGSSIGMLSVIGRARSMEL